MARKDKDSAESAIPKPTPTKPASGAKETPKKLGDILIQAGLVSEAQLEEALEKQDSTGGFIGQALVELKYIDQQTLSLVLVKQCKVPHLNILEYQVDAEIGQLIPEEMSHKHRVLAIDKIGKMLTVAMVDPTDIGALTAVREAFPDLRIKPILCDWPHYEAVFRRLFHSDEAATSGSEISLKSLRLSSAKAPPKKKAPEAPAPEAVVDDIPLAPILEPEGDGGALQAQMNQLTLAVQGLATSGSGNAALEEKLTRLESTVTRIIDATDILSAASNAERAMVAGNTQQDLENGQPNSNFGVERVPASNENTQPAAAGPEGDASLRQAMASGAPLAGFTFETFIVGETNKAAFNTSRAVAEAPGGEYNPVFICGDVGLGKTHLINAIGNHIAEHNAALRVGYASASRFAAHALEAQRMRLIEAFRESYCEWDVLILDDVQFLGGHVEAQEEFFHIFNAYQQQGRQIVIAGDKPPEKLGLLERRLVSRFAGGIISFLNPPEWETRMQILHARAETLKGKFSDDVLAMIAMKYQGDVRLLIGALQKVHAFAALQKLDVTPELTNEVLIELQHEAVA